MVLLTQSDLVGVEFVRVGSRVRLREFQPGDLEAAYAYASDPEVVRYMTWGPNDMLSTQAFIQAVIDEARQPVRHGYQLAIIESPGHLIGAVSLQVTNRANRRGELGYVLRRDRWGQGLATDAAILMLDFGFRDLGLHRIEATCSPENIGSARVLEKIGMSREGRLREHLWVKGVWEDSLLFAIVDTQWPS